GISTASSTVAAPGRARTVSEGCRSRMRETLRVFGRAGRLLGGREVAASQLARKLSASGRIQEKLRSPLGDVNRNSKFCLKKVGPAGGGREPGRGGSAAGGGEHDLKGCPLAQGAGQGDPPAMGVDDFLADGQPQSAAAGLARASLVHAEEAV